MTRLRITGGPSPRDVRITVVRDGEDDVDITAAVLRLELNVGAQDELLKAKATFFAEYDLEVVPDRLPRVIDAEYTTCDCTADHNCEAHRA